jgi:hypothetical protein
MMQSPGGLRLAHEGLFDALVTRRLFTATRLQLNRFQDQLTVQHRIHCQICDRMPVSPQLPQDRIAADQLEILGERFRHRMGEALPQANSIRTHNQLALTGKKDAETGA